MTGSNPFPRGAAKAKHAKGKTAKAKPTTQAPPRKRKAKAQGNGQQQHQAAATAPGTTLDPIGDVMREFNAEFMVVNEGGKAMIYAPHLDPILKRIVYDRMTRRSLEELYANHFVTIINDKGKPVRRNAAALWWRHPDRRQYKKGVVFDPANTVNSPDIFNLWQGFAIQPKPGSWAKLQEHLLTNVCDTDETHYDYLLNLLSDLVQHPGKPGEIAIVLQGREGCGKGTLARPLLRIFGQHGLHISNGLHLTGRFNLHLRDCCFLFADEAFYAGDKAHIGVLKALITEPLLTIEGKYANAVQAANRLHILQSSNEDWVIPAALDSRRFYMRCVSDARCGDHAYFAAINEELDNGGTEAMLYDLLRRDLTGVNLRNPPSTDALVEQRKRSMPTHLVWWGDCLQRGYVFVSRLGLEDYFQRWHEFIATELLFNSYLNFAQARRERHVLSRELFGQWMRTLGAKPERRRNQIVGEHQVDVPTPSGGITRQAEPVTQATAHGFHLGTLKATREAFSETTGLSAVWEDIC
jgi:hypothetical protein